MEFDVILGALMSLGILGVPIMLALPECFAGLGGWLFVSFVLIPGALIIIALMVNVPAIGIGLVFLAGVLATNK